MLKIIDLVYQTFNLNFAVQMIYLLIFAIFSSPIMLINLYLYYTLPYIKHHQYSQYILDVYVPSGHSQSTHPRPVLIYLAGGAWMLSDRRVGILIGKYTLQNDIILVVPSYGNFPFVNVKNMIHNSQMCIKWVIENIHQYNGDAHNITIMGHSSGAHVGYNALYSCTQTITPSISVETVHKEELLLCENQALLKSIFKHHVKAFVGISGPYRTYELEETLNRFGFSKSVFSNIFGKQSYNTMKHFSSYWLINSPIDECIDIPLFLIHGYNDLMVSANHTLVLKNILQHKGYTVQDLYCDKQHSDFVVEDLLFHHYDTMDVIRSIVYTGSCEDHIDDDNFIVTSEQYQRCPSCPYSMSDSWKLLNFKTVSQCGVELLLNSYYSLLKYINPF